MKHENILKKLEAIEFSKRCIEAYICPQCGEDIKDITSPSNHWTGLACQNTKCTEHGKIKKSWN